MDKIRMSGMGEKSKMAPKEAEGMKYSRVWHSLGRWNKGRRTRWPCMKSKTANSDFGKPGRLTHAHYLSESRHYLLLVL